MSTKTDEWEEEYEKLAIEMNLREETISGTDERGRIKNFIIDLRTRHDTYWKERVLAIIEEHDPSSDRDANPRYWGKTLREAIKSLR